MAVGTMPDPELPSPYDVQRYAQQVGASSDQEKELAALSARYCRLTDSTTLARFCALNRLRGYRFQGRPLLCIPGEVMRLRQEAAGPSRTLASLRREYWAKMQTILAPQELEAARRLWISESRMRCGL